MKGREKSFGWAVKLPAPAAVSWRSLACRMWLWMRDSQKAEALVPAVPPGTAHVSGCCPSISLQNDVSYFIRAGLSHVVGFW